MVLRAKSTLLLVLVASATGMRAQDRTQPEVDVPALLRSLDDPTFDSRSFLTLVEQGRAVVPKLFEILDRKAANDDALTRRRHQRALRVLRMLDRGCLVSVVAGLAKRVDAAEDADYDDVIGTILDVSARLPAGDSSSSLLDDLLKSLTAEIQGRAKRNIRSHGDVLLTIVRHIARMSDLRNADLNTQIEGLQSDDPAVRELAAECIGRRGSEAIFALDALRAQMTASDYPTKAKFRTQNISASTGRDFSGMIRDAVSTAIARIAPQDPLARRGHALLLHADDPRERVAAAMALGAPTEADAVDVSRELLAATEDDDPLVAGEAVTALGRVGKTSRQVLDRLRNLERGGGALGARAKIALKRLEPAAVRDRK